MAHFEGTCLTSSSSSVQSELEGEEGVRQGGRGGEGDGCVGFLCRESGSRRVGVGEALHDGGEEDGLWSFCRGGE